jgi:hypothetical protein
MIDLFLQKASDESKMLITLKSAALFTLLPTHDSKETKT